MHRADPGRPRASGLVLQFSRVQPTRHSAALPRLTPAVKRLLLGNVAVFVLNLVALELVAGGLSPWLRASRAELVEWFRLEAGLGPLRLLSYQFLHDWQSPLHLLLNLVALYFFGTMVEERIGARRLLRLYLAAGAAGGLVHVATSPVPVIGASGACFGLLAYAACMQPQQVFLLLVWPVRLWALAAVLIGLGVWHMWSELVTGTSDGVAHGGHVGGALWGLVAFCLLRSRPAWLERVRRWQLRRQQRRAQTQREILDRLLDKVKRLGLPSLTAAERRFLQRASEELRR